MPSMLRASRFRADDKATMANSVNRTHEFRMVLSMFPRRRRAEWSSEWRQADGYMPVAGAFHGRCGD